MSFIQTNNLLSATKNESEVLWRLIDSEKSLNSSQISKYEKTNLDTLNYRTTGHITTRFKEDGRIKVVKTIPKGHTEYYFRPTILGYLTFLRNVDTANFKLDTEKFKPIIPDIAGIVYGSHMTNNFVSTGLHTMCENINIEKLDGIFDGLYDVDVTIQIPDNYFKFGFNLKIEEKDLEKELTDLIQSLLVIFFEIKFNSERYFEKYQKTRKQLIKIIEKKNPVYTSALNTVKFILENGQTQPTKTTSKTHKQRRLN